MAAVTSARLTRAFRRADPPGAPPARLRRRPLRPLERPGVRRAALIRERGVGPRARRRRERRAVRKAICARPATAAGSSRSSRRPPPSRRSAAPPWPIRCGSAGTIAVGADEGEAVLNIAANSSSSSLFEMSALHVASAPESAYVGTRACGGPAARLARKRARARGGDSLFEGGRAGRRVGRAPWRRSDPRTCGARRGRTLASCRSTRARRASTRSSTTSLSGVRRALARTGVRRSGRWAAAPGRCRVRTVGETDADYPARAVTLTRRVLHALRRQLPASRARSLSLARAHRR